MAAPSDVDFPGAFISNIRLLPTTSEILCSEGADFLPKQHHESGISRLVDSQFRLLREDTCGLIRDSVRSVLRNWQVLVHGRDWKLKRQILSHQSPTPIRLYFNVRVQQLKADPLKGMEIDMEFDQLYKLAKLSPAHREKWWRESDTLREGSSILALIDGECQDKISVVFCLVSRRVIECSDRHKKKGYPGPIPVRDLVSNATRASVVLRLADQGYEADVSNLVRLKSDKLLSRSLLLVEFPALSYKSFEGILRRLQDIHQSHARVPFARWLEPGKKHTNLRRCFTKSLTAGEIMVPPPAYIKDGMVLDFSCLPKSARKLGDIDALLKVSLPKDSRALSDQLSKFTTLNTAQADAMAAALRQEVVLIQGPPGTGKSYVGVQLAKCLLQNRDILQLGPILCVCYTNHALDQFLNELLNSGITNIIRIGHASESRLAELSLDHVKKSRSKTAFDESGRTSRVNTNASKAKLLGLSLHIDEICKSINEDGKVVGRYIRNEFPEQSQYLLNILPDQDIWELTTAERVHLYEHWKRLAFSELSEQLCDFLKQHVQEKQNHTRIYHEYDTVILNESGVIGVTTTGLANNANLLRDVNAKVLICEEAAEILESHMLTALLPSIQHLIMIGDYLQLRPRISNPRLSMGYNGNGPKYNFDQSLFERLASSKFCDLSLNSHPGQKLAESRFPISQLSHQHRMHPLISTLIRETLYPGLQDHPRTKEYSNIAGMKRRLFWLDHRNWEDTHVPDEPMQSKTNVWEARMVVTLAKHLYRQERYGSRDLAILTPYAGQLKVLKKMLEDTNLNKLRLAIIDDFQGEEATVVIVSLVRSNKRHDCGFLKSPNRINVLLSRAKEGMYIIGDAATAATAPLWQSVIELFKKGQNIGQELQLSCARHPKQTACVSNPDDFSRAAPEGGCAQTCGLRLHCGHRCTLMCHSETHHRAVRCMQLCHRMRDCGHFCNRRCNQPCGECPELVENIMLPCGHTIVTECGKIATIFKIKCQEAAVRTMAPCGHKLEVRCHENSDNLDCSHTCDTRLPCGHVCSKVCWNCRGGDHGPCNEICGRAFNTCSHACSRPCHPGSTCPPCTRPCEIRCRHNQCPKNCNEPCPPCAELCEWSCEHRDKCNLPCAVPCDIIPCNLRCTKSLSCGHQCPGVCGESCPTSDHCQICCKPEVLSRNVDLIEFKEYRNIDIDKDPLLFLSCGHFYTRSSLDGVMEMRQYYSTDDSTGKIIGPKRETWGFDSHDIPKGCPECRMSLRDVDRYNRVIKKALLNEATKRFVTWAHAERMNLLNELEQLEIEIENDRALFISKCSKPNTNNHKSTQINMILDLYKKRGTELYKKIKNFGKLVSKTEQPFGRVRDLLAYTVAKQRGILTSFNFDDSVIQTGFQLYGQSMSLRLVWAMLWDFHVVSAHEFIDPRIAYVLCKSISTRTGDILEKCLALMSSSKHSKFLVEEVQAKLYHVKFSTLSIINQQIQRQPLDLGAQILAREQAEMTLNECESLCLQYPGTLNFLRNDIQKVWSLVNGLEFYTFVTNEETRQVYDAMAEQFSGTGHWYYCRNNHPFTIGECGMPTEEARCPECGASVGGQDHVFVQGISRAFDMEHEFSRGG
ncbi:hypothetical protein BGW36DRAFT_443478 [Talaromyces proteolyticus]|uniref:RZ-type domain-containing protein n=1 Tax=Talaromyces proteolyticus TaxID=1131652 RepID=A0AAD4Q259_9EURO|nr:uncharacterized protein BGW36DRAFT_443478 [Talaromyces proteolyticus]KAH8703337.1 hypothetical protein BGW36DRAFT_443478 [Talaromyces proteolyticus]